MTILYYLLIAAGAFSVGWVGTFAVRRAATLLGLVQAPNARSSHSIPTPQGGGIVIAAIIIASALFASTVDNSFLVLAALSAITAALGFADDILDLPAALRFPIQGMVLVVLIESASPLPDLLTPFGIVVGSWALPLLVWITALWWVNLFNFMDGIDGIAASQAITILLGSLGIAASVDTAFPATPLALLALSTAAATGGFLVMNWAPARIFMGDAGSNTLALLILFIAIGTVSHGLLGYPAWLILLSPFTADTTVALLRRIARGERPWRPHRRHGYQQLARRWSHAHVALLYTGLAGFVALPLAAAAQHYPTIDWWLVSIAYAGLASLAWWSGSGDAAERN